MGSATPRDALMDLTRQQCTIGVLTEDRAMATIPQPTVGDWYRSPTGASFEVVAYDDDDGTIEIQYFDGTIEEWELEDWEAQWKDGAIEASEAPEDWSGSVDFDPPQEDFGSDNSSDRDLRASPLEDIERFR
jgi:hypothetical protein